MPSQQEEEEEVVTEAITADSGEDMKQTSPSKIIISSSTLQSNTIIDNNDNGSYKTINNTNNKNNNENTDAIIIINCNNNNNNNNVPKNTENNQNYHSNYTTTGAKQISPNRNNNNNNNSFIIISDDTDDHSNSELINNIHQMISNTNNTNNNSKNKNLQNSFMTEYDDTPYTSSSSNNSNSSNFNTGTSIPSTNNVNISMNSYVSNSNNLNFKNFTPTISYTTSNNNNNNNTSNFMVPFTPSNNNYNPFNNNVVRPFIKQIPTFNNPQLNVLTPQMKNNSHGRLKPPTQQQLDRREVEIEKIVTRKYVDGKMFYRIQWEGFPRKCNSWLSSERLEKYKDVLEEHDRRNRKLTEVLSSCTNSNDSSNSGDHDSVDHHGPFIAGNSVPQPRPLPKKIKLDPDISNGWKPHSMNNNTNHVHNYSSHHPAYPSQNGLQRAPQPQNMLSGISQQKFYTPSISTTNNNNNRLPSIMTKYHGFGNYSPYADNITRKYGTNSFGSIGNINNTVGPIHKPNISPWSIQTPTQSPVRVVRPIPKIVHVPAYPAVLPISSIDYVHKGNMTTFTIRFLPCFKTLELPFERQQVSTFPLLTNDNGGGGGKPELLEPLITIDEIYCMNGTEVIVLATLENEKQKKYFPINDVLNVFPKYLYCFVLNETMRLRPNCANLT